MSGKNPNHTKPGPAKQPYPRDDIKKDVARVVGLINASGVAVKLKKIPFRMYREHGGKYEEWLFYKGRKNRPGYVPEGFTSFQDAVSAATTQEKQVEQENNEYEYYTGNGCVTLYEPATLICRRCDNPFESWDRKLNRVCNECKYVHGTAESTVTEDWLNSTYADNVTHELCIPLNGGAFERYGIGY